jgi:hypothetical protein
VDLIGLHMTLYLLREAERWTEKDGPLRLVLEIVAPKKTVVRELSSKSFRDNCERTGRAVETYARETVQRTEPWTRAHESRDRGEREELLRRALEPVLGDPKAPREAVESALAAGAVDPHAVLEALVTYAKQRHEQHFGACHAAWTQSIGLATRRGTNRVRYAPSDHLLKTLVLAVVKDRMEFQEFLDALWERYRFVIGHRQAAALVGEGEGDRVAFEDNARRLEQRLASLGLLRRLSDACAYVENPVGAPR